MIWNVTRGSRLETYALEGPAGSGLVCVNGAAAHYNRPGDRIIIATFAGMDEAEARAHQPTVVLVDETNRIREAGANEVAGPQRRSAG